MIRKTLSYHCIYRCINIAKVVLSYVASALCHKHISLGMPFTASIEPANYCNLRCRQCPTGLGMTDRQKAKMTIEDFKKTLDALLPDVMYVNLYFQGEPLLNTDVPEMVAYATKHGVSTCISTNGHFLSQNMSERLKQAGLDRLIISLDGADSESYSLYRTGGNFDTVIQGVKNAVGAGLKVELQCLLLSSTENRKNEIQEIGRKLGADRITFKTAQFYNQDELMPANEHNSRYRKGTLELKRGLRNRCWRIISGIVINTEGEVIPCCYDKKGLHSYGNLLKAGGTKKALCDILNSQRAIDFKNRVFSNRKCIQICTNCTE